MSGVEVAGLVCGVLPIFIETLKAYSFVSRSLHTFRHYSKAVKSVRVQFYVHQGIFFNECRLLLRLVEDEQGTKDMLDDENDSRWCSKEFNDKMNSILKDNFELCKRILEATKEIADEMKEELRKFDILVERKDNDESIKSAVRRLRSAVNFCFDKPKFEKSLTELRDRNFELTTLRTHIGLFQQKPCLERACLARSTLPPGIAAIRTASGTLLEALSSSWCCADSSHSQHHAKICLDAEVGAEVRLDIAIACQDTSSSNSDRCPPEPPIWLYVRSLTIDTTSYEKVPETLTNSKKRSSPDATLVPTTDQQAVSSTRFVACKVKKKRVRFLGGNEGDMDNKSIDSLPEDVRHIISETVARQTTSTINLCQTQNICHYLKQNLQLCGNSLSKHCVGYLESPKKYRHVFYLQKRRLETNSKQNQRKEGSLFSIFDLMAQKVEDALTIVDQLKLAHKAALAMLQFNDTPWLSPRWRLADVSYFGSGGVFNEDSLKTLHLSSQLAPRQQRLTSDMEGIEAIKPLFSEEEYFGIENPTLFSLGVALLEIAHWQPLESLSTLPYPNEYVAARRLASRPTPLGPKYQEIARKCLQCNFGFGTDLKKKELQAGVYGDVVCQLEKMIETLSI